MLLKIPIIKEINMREKFVGRQQFVKQIQNLINDTNSNKKLRILSIEGSGGLGKSTLLDHTLSNEILHDNQYLILRIDGNASNVGDIYDIISTLINSASSAVTLSKKPGQLFPNTTNIIKAFKNFQNELIKSYSEKDNSLNTDAIYECLKPIVNVGKTINTLSPQTKIYLDAEELEQVFERIKEITPDLQIMQREGINLIQKLTLNSQNVNLRNTFREHPLLPLSNALIEDLSAILQKPQKKTRAAPMKIAGIDRLLVIIDDFEALQNSMIDFLTEYFFKDLKRSAFESFICILGRDTLSNTSPNWDQHFQHSLMDPIRLKYLNKEEVFELAEIYNIQEITIKEKIWSDTEGYPYYIHLWTTEAEQGGVTATSLKQFYTRMTRWLSPKQKDWLEKIVFLDEISIYSVQKTIFSKEAKEITEWFQNEASLRDTQSLKFRFRPFVRSRILEYIKISDPQNFKNLYSEAKLINDEILKFNREIETI